MLANSDSCRIPCARAFSRCLEIVKLLQELGETLRDQIFSWYPGVESVIQTWSSISIHGVPRTFIARTSPLDLVLEGLFQLLATHDQLTGRRERRMTHGMITTHLKLASLAVLANEFDLQLLLLVLCEHTSYLLENLAYKWARGLGTITACYEP